MLPNKHVAPSYAVCAFSEDEISSYKCYVTTSFNLMYSFATFEYVLPQVVKLIKFFYLDSTSLK